MNRRPLANRTRIGLPLAGALSILLAWEFLVPLAGVPGYIVPTPTTVAGVFRSDWPVLLANLWPTAIESVAGFLIGNTAAVGLAVVFVYSRTIQAAYFPIVLFFNTIPVLALAPIIVLIFGLGLLPKIVIAAVICFFPTLVNMIRGLDSATRNERELLHILSATPWETFWRLRFPRSLPLLFASLRIASTTAVIGAIVGEWIGSDKGIGALIIQATFNYRAGELYAAIVLSSSLAIALFAIVTWVERRVLRHE